MTPIPPAERMADDADRAAHHDEAHLARALAHHALRAKPSEPWAPGVCRNCSEQPIAGVWCDRECESDWRSRSCRGLA
jgi:hypothetical protein